MHIRHRRPILPHGARHRFRSYDSQETQFAELFLFKDSDAVEPVECSCDEQKFVALNGRMLMSAAGTVKAKEFQLKAPMCSHHEIAAKKGRVLW
jgi:hypothetical protein